MREKAKCFLAIVSIVLFSFVSVENMALAQNIGFNALEVKSFSSNGESSQLVIGLNKAHAEGFANLTRLIGQVNGKIIDQVSIRGEVIAVVVDVPGQTTCLAFLSKY